MRCIRTPLPQNLMQKGGVDMVKLGRAASPAPGRSGDPLQDMFETIG